MKRRRRIRFGASIPMPDGGEALYADAEHPVSSSLRTDGGLSQMGISGEGFQREVNVSRHTETQPGGKYRFCWELSLYQHPGIRRQIPIACTVPRRSRPGQLPPPAPPEARRISRAFHELAKAGYDPRHPPAGGGGIPRGKLWHQVMLPALCSGGATLDSVRRVLRDHGVYRKGK